MTDETIKNTHNNDTNIESLIVSGEIKDVVEGGVKKGRAASKAFSDSVRIDPDAILEPCTV